MKKSIKQRWINALLSGEFIQTSAVFSDKVIATGEVRYCALGVLHELLAPGAWEENTEGPMDGMPPELIDRSPTGVNLEVATGITQAEKGAVSLKNDNDGYTFPQMADFIRTHISEHQ